MDEALLPASNDLGPQLGLWRTDVAPIRRQDDVAGATWPIHLY